MNTFVNPLLSLHSEPSMQKSARETKKQKRVSLMELLGSSMLSPPTSPPASPPATPLPAESLCVRVEGVSASWSYDKEKLVLSNINLEVNKVRMCDLVVMS